MGCKVEKIVLPNGESSDLFRSLANSMPPARALETYLEIANNKESFIELYGENSQGEVNYDTMMGTPKFRLEEFKTYQEQSDTMDFLARNLIDTLKEMASTKSNSTISGIDLSKIANDPSIMPIAIRKSIKAMDASLTENFKQLKATDAYNLRVQAVTNMSSYLATKEGLGPLGYKLKDYGIHLDVRQSFVDIEIAQDTEMSQDPDVDTVEKATKIERIYDMDILESSVSNTILDNVKVYLKNLRRVADDYSSSEPALRYQVSRLGTARPMRYEQVLGKMYAVLKGIQSPAEMIGRLEKAAKESIELLPILHDLKQEQKEPSTVMIDGNKTLYKPIATALYATFAKQDYNMFTIAEDNGNVVFFQSNSVTKSRVIQNTWAEDITAIQKQEKADLRDQLIKTQKYIKKRGLQQSLNRKSGPNMIELNQAANLFRAAGFYNITGHDLKNLIQFVKDNKVKLSKKVADTPYRTISFFMKTMVEKVLEGKDIYAKSEGDFSHYNSNEGRNLKMLSSVVAARSTDTSLGAFYSGRGTMVHPINQGSEAQDIWNRMREPDTRSMFSIDPLYRNTSIMLALEDADHSAMFDVATMDVLNDNARPASGVTWGNLSSFDAAASRLNAYFSVGNKNYFMAMSPTQGDRGKVSGLTLPKLGVNEGGEAKPLFVKGEMKDGEIKDWIYNQIHAELQRIAKVKASPSKYKNYGTNATRFNLFTELNEMNLDNMVNSESSIISHTDLAMARMTTEEGIFKSIINEDIKFLEDINLIVQDGKKYKPANRDAQRVLSKAIGKNKVISAENLQNLLANNLISTYDQTLFYLGDPAYFSSKSESLQKVDLNKRFALPFTPGSKLAVGDALGIKKKAKIKILQEPKWDSSWADVYQTLTNSEKYKGIEIADGAGFVSLQRYRSIMMSQGMHTDGMLAYIDAHIAWKPGQAVPTLKADLEVLKTFYYRLQPTGDGSIAPFNLKYSIMPVIPAFFEATDGGTHKHGDMAAISRELRLGQADEVVMSSAVKVGESNAIGSAMELGEGNFTEIYNDSVRIPQVSVTKNDTETMFGTQMRKIIAGNYSTNKPLRINSQAVDAGIALQNYDGAIKMVTKKNGDEVYRTFLKGGQVNETELVRKLLSDLDNNPHNNVDYYKEALTTVNDAKQRLLPLNYPTIKYKMDSLINAAFRNKVNRLKLPGHKAVQVPSFGMNQVGVGSDLKFLRVKPVGDKGALSPANTLALIDRYNKGDLNAFDGYEITPGEIRITPKFFTNTIKNIASDAINTATIDKAVESYEKNLPEGLAAHVRNRMSANYRKDMTAVLHTREVNRITKLISTNGKYDIDKVRKYGLDTIVLYRIPTGGKNLMMHGTIKDFLIEGMGSTIQVPAEIVDQAGSDFDIDSVTVEMTDFKEDGAGGLEGINYMNEDGDIDIKTTAEAKSYIKDFHAAVLSSPAYFADVLRPDGVDMIRNLAENVFNQTDDMFTGNWGSLALQETFRNNNKSGKDLISISSVASVAHALAPHIGAAIIKAKNIAGNNIGVLGGEFNRDLQNPVKISSEIAEIQTAALDNTKEPWLGRLNIDKLTASTVLMLVSNGYGLEYATTIVNAPIIKDLAGIFPMYSRRFTPKEALRLSAEFVMKKRGINKRTGIGQYNSATYTLQVAQGNLDGSSKVKQAVALKAFLDMHKVGEGFARFQGTMNFDSKGTPSTVPGLLSRYTKLAGVPGTEAYARERGETVLHRKGKDATKSVEYKNKTEMLKAIVSNSKKVSLRPDGSMYEVNIDGAVLSMNRLSTYLGHIITNPGPQVKRANNAGTIIDNLGREFFTKGSIVNTGNMSEQAEKGLNKVFDRLKAHFETTGEKVITDKDYLKVFDSKLKVAGEMDIITIDNNKVLRIYDMKTEKDSTIAELMQATGGRKQGYSRVAAENFLEDRYNKRGRQLNGYRGLMRNMTGIIAAELNIIPLPITYNEDGTFIEEVRQPPELFESHDIAEGIIPDTRVFEDVRNERILDKLELEAQKSMFMVDSTKYNESYMGEVERQTIHAPLTVNRKTSPSASVQLQSVLREATKAVGGFMNEKQQQNLFIAYDSYLALNSLGSRAIKSSLSKRLMTGSHLAMTNQISGTASKLQAYRDHVKNLGINENSFTENLTIVSHEGRKFVTFNNMVARGLTAEAKKEMMFYFEDLMDAGENTIEQKLAKELADYAIIHYGFSRQFNSFLEFVPPRAHQEYMNTTKGDGKVTLPNFFRQIQKDFDNVDKFKSPEEFVEMWVQNNADKLPLRRISKMRDGEFNLNWKWDLIEEAMREKTDPPQYVLRTHKGETELWGLEGRGNYTFLQKRGVQGYVTEYYTGESLYNDAVGESTAQKAKATEDNQAVINNISTETVRPYFDKVADFAEVNFETEAQARQWVVDIGNMLEKNKQFTKEELSFVAGELNLEVDAAVSNFKRLKKAGKQGTFNDVLVNYLEGVIEDSLDLNKSILKKIVNCK